MLVCTTISMTRVKQIKNHTKSVMQFILLIENIEILIEYKNMSISEIFDFVCNNENYSCLTFLNDIKNGLKNYYDTLDKVFADKKLLYVFDCEDIEYISGFFSVLGSSDTNGQILNCNLYKKLFEKKYSQLKSSEKTECKCVSTLSIGLGLLISITII